MLIPPLEIKVVDEDTSHLMFESTALCSGSNEYITFLKEFIEGYATLKVTEELRSVRNGLYRL